MIKTFGNQGTSDIFYGVDSKAARKVCPPAVWPVAVRKLDAIHAAGSLDDLRSPPANRLHPLKGSLEGYWAIRVNDQYRVIFVWAPAERNAYQVEVTDYH